MLLFYIVAGKPAERYQIDSTSHEAGEPLDFTRLLTLWVLVATHGDLLTNELAYNHNVNLDWVDECMTQHEGLEVASGSRPIWCIFLR